jgi:hypothetical protein
MAPRNGVFCTTWPYAPAAPDPTRQVKDFHARRCLDRPHFVEKPPLTDELGLTCVTADGRIIIVPRNADTFIDATPEELKPALEDVARYNRRLRGRLSEAKHAYIPPARPIMADRQSLEVGQAIRAAEEQHAKEQQERKRASANAQRLAAREGVPSEYVQNGRGCDPETRRGLELLQGLHDE